MISAQQHQFFMTFGYLVLPQALHEDITWICDEFEQVWRDRADILHDGSQRTMYPGSFITARPRLSTLIEHPIVNNSLDALLGVGWSSYGGDGNFYSGDTNWHSDAGTNDAKTIIPHVKVAFYLDALTASTGALRVIPGSHHWKDTYWRLLEEQVGAGEAGPLGLHGSHIPAVSLNTQPGDLVFFDHRLKHASYGGGKRRRMFAINTFAPCRTDAQREAAKEVLRWYRDHQQVNWLTRVGWMDWIETLSPVGQRNHAQTIELGRQVMEEGLVIS